MTIVGKTAETFTARFIDQGTDVLLELTNQCSRTLKHVEILTIFLKDEETEGGPSRVHISFEVINSIRPNESMVVTHRTWIDGKRRHANEGHLGRLRGTGPEKSYVLDISWEDVEGKTQYQRIPVGID